MYRYGDRYGIPPAVGGGVHHRAPIEPLMPPGVTSRYESQPAPTFRRYDHYDVAPPGTGPDIPGIGPYEKPRYDRPPGVGSSYDRPGSYDNRSSTHEDFLTPPGVDHRYGGSRERDRDRGSRERDIAPPGVRERDIGPPGVRDRDRDLGLRDRDIGPPGVRDRDLPPSWERDRSRDDPGAVSRDRDIRDKDRDIRDSERDRDRGSRDYYESDHRRSYESKSYSYNSPDSKKRRQSLSPPRHTGVDNREHYSSGERHHRHGGRSDSRRKMASSQQGKENRQQLTQPVETVVDAMGQRDKDKESGGQKRERVLVEVRKEPSVDRDRTKKDDKAKSKEELDDKNKKGKDKKKKKKEKEVDGEKLKKKKRKEKKEGKKDSTQETVDKNKADNVKKDKQAVHKARDDKQETVSENKTEGDAEKRKPVAQGDKVSKSALLRTLDAPSSDNMVDGLYGDMEDTRIDDTVIANYGKVIVEEGSAVKVKEENKGTESGGEADGLLGNEGAQSLGVQQGEQVVKEENMDEARIKSEGGSDSDGAKSEKANVMLAPLPEPSKWELEEEYPPSSAFEKKDNDDRASTGSTGIDKGSAGKVVTSEVLKRAENAIFQKAINAIRPIEPSKKAAGDRKVYTGAEKEKRLAGEVVVASAAESSDPNARKLLDKETREARKTANSIQITIPIAGNHAERSVEIASLESSQQASKSKGKPERQKFTGASGGSQWGDASDSMSPHRVSAKERLGARVDGENEKKHDDERSRSRNIGRHRSRSESRDRKHGTSKKGLKSTVEKKRTVSRSRSRSPHHGRKMLDRKHQDVVDPRRYIDGRYVDIVPDRKYVTSSDLRGKRSERDGRYVEADRHIQERVADGRRREHSETKKEIIKSPERRRERSDSRERKSDKIHTKQKEEREKSVEKVKKHKNKKKTKRRSESRSRKKSASDRESKRGKKKDKKHKKDKGKKHKANEKEKAEKEEEKAEKETTDSVAPKDSKAGTSTNEATDAARNEPSGTAEDDQSKEKTRKGGRRNPRLASDRKKSTLDEASFEPDYDASSSVDTETEEGVEGDKKNEGTDKKTAGSKDASPSEGSPTKKRDRSTSADPSEQKRPKLDKDSEKAEKGGGEETSKKSNGGNGKSGSGSKTSSKKRGRSVSSSDSSDEDSSDEDDDDSSSGSSSSSDDDSSDDSSVHRRRKKKSRHRRRGKRSKKSSRRASNSSSDSDSESESGSSSDSGSGRGRRGSGRSKKHRHRSKASKKKKKSKHR